MQLIYSHCFEAQGCREGSWNRKQNKTKPRREEGRVFVCMVLTAFVPTYQYSDHAGKAKESVSGIYNEAVSKFRPLNEPESSVKVTRQ